MKKISLCAVALVLACVFAVGNASASPATLRITCWGGYAKPYVKDFQALVKKKYNLDLKVKIHNPVDQDEFYEAAKKGTADIISPPQDLAKNPKFYCFTKGAFLLQEPDLKNIPNFKHILPFFKKDQALIHEGKRYGVPYNCGPYGLGYNTEKVKTAPTSWNILLDPKYKNQYTINNNFPKCNIWICALGLGYGYNEIFDIAKMDRAKIQKRLNLLVKNAKSLWDGAANPDEFPELALATSWGFAVQKANLKGGKWLLAAPKEGGTAWIDYWCITRAAKGQTKKLCEEWINFMLDPVRQADVVHAQGVSPAVDNVGDLVNPEEKKIFHVGDNDYFKTVALWRVMDEKTTKAFAEMWAEAKKQREK
ncbi:MAG: extracellular solute-binding protein [Deltaproteobacteria bacterium]|nr:extracellular solute-binding protein [Deltaproteobacteria bacterium]